MVGEGTDESKSVVDYLVWKKKLYLVNLVKTRGGTLTGTVNCG